MSLLELMIVSKVPSRVIRQRQLYGDQYDGFGHKKALHLHVRLLVFLG
jgi:hypothetical protein